MRGLPLISKLAFILLFFLLTPAPVDPSSVAEPEPIRCASCDPDTLDACPAVPPGCKEMIREPGCGCCMSCALHEGAACGVHTAHCGTGLRCVPRADDPYPLHSLTHGQAVCTVDLPASDELDERDDSLHHMLGLDKAGDPEAHGRIKAKANAIRKKLVHLGPCHGELHSALDTIAASQQILGEKFATFYLPNCNKHGFYNTKQCETSLVGQPAQCWCVSTLTGKRIEGSSDVPEDALCHQEITH